MGKRVLVVYFSQTGEVQRAVDAFTAGFGAAGAQVDVVRLEPVPPYPYPWNVGAFLDVFPDSLNGDSPRVEAPGLDPTVPYDLVVLGYQVWFLSPSTPHQGFLDSDASRVLAGRPVVTLTVSRNMWHNGFLKLRGRLEERGAKLVDNVVINHQGAPWTTFITTVRSLITGKKDRMMGLPSASVGEDRIEQVRSLGEVVAGHLAAPDPFPRALCYADGGAVVLNRNYMVPEIIGGRAFAAWARGAKRIGEHSRLGKRLFLVLFIVLLGLGIVTVIPLSILVLSLFGSRWRDQLEQRAVALQAPSGP